MASHNIEYRLAEAARALLASSLSAAIQAAAPLVAWIDTNSDDDQNRIIVRVPSARNVDHSVGNTAADLEIVVKSRVTPPADMATALSGHWDRVAAVRDVFASDEIVTELAAAGTGLAIQHVLNVRDNSTSTSDFHLYSTLRLTVQCCPTT